MSNELRVIEHVVMLMTWPMGVNWKDNIILEEREVSMLDATLMESDIFLKLGADPRDSAS